MGPRVSFKLRISASVEPRFSVAIRAGPHRGLGLALALGLGLTLGFRLRVSVRVGVKVIVRVWLTVLLQSGA